MFTESSRINPEHTEGGLGLRALGLILGGSIANARNNGRERLGFRRGLPKKSKLTTTAELDDHRHGCGLRCARKARGRCSKARGARLRI